MSERDTAARDGRVLVLAPTSKDAVDHAGHCCQSAGIPVEICPTFDDAGRGAASGRRAPSWSPKKRCRAGAQRDLARSPRRTAALVRSAGARPDAPGADSAELGRSRPNPRQRDAAGAAACAWRRCSARSARPCARASASTRFAGTSRSGRAPRNRCASPISARTSSSRRSATSCAIRWRRC